MNEVDVMLERWDHLSAVDITLRWNINVAMAEDDKIVKTPSAFSA